MPHLRDILPLPIHSYTSLSSQLITITSALGTSASWVGQTIVAEELKGVDGGKGVQKREAKWGSGGNSGVEGNMGKMGKAGNEYGGDAGSPGVVVVSFIHDRKFWAEGLRKLGIDISALPKRFIFIDGLTELFNEDHDDGVNARSSTGTGTVPSGSVPAAGGNRGQTTLPLRSPGLGPLPSRGQPVPAQTPQPPQPPQPSATSPVPKLHLPRTSSTNSNPLHPLFATISSALSRFTSPPLLLLESPDLLLATLFPAVTPSSLTTSFLLLLRSLASSTVLLLNADTPFLLPARDCTANRGAPAPAGHGSDGLSTYLSAFLISCIHESAFTVSVRGLDTGVARDVSGVMRVTFSGENESLDSSEEEEEEDEEGGKWRSMDMFDEKEVLYYVRDSGVVEVWGRGEVRR